MDGMRIVWLIRNNRNECDVDCDFRCSDRWDSWCFMKLDKDDRPSDRCPGPGTYTLKLEKIDE
jgi:hypothetical protein